MIGRIAAFVACVIAAPAAAQLPPPERILAADADPAVTQFNDASLVLRPARTATDVPLALFLPGSGGDALRADRLGRVVAELGYPFVSLAYNNTPALRQACKDRPDPACAARFREMRLWGTGGSPRVRNSASETIAARLVALLRRLDALHPNEAWRRYVRADGQPDWANIVVSGSSQGAGMAAFVAKREKVARVVLFSSPVDMVGGINGTELAPWLHDRSATPMDRWFAERNSREPFNPMLLRAYPALGIAEDHVRVFARDLPAGIDAANPNAYHTINTRDPRYADDWRFLYGTPASLR